MDQLDQIRQKIDIVQLISEYLPLKKAGRNFKANCPFHSEKTPSFVVSPERQIWHCFGGCQDGGDIFKFLMRWENIEFFEAAKILAKRANVTLESYVPTEASKLRERIYQVNHLASEFYHYLLLNHSSGKKALDYILGRGIKKKTLETFKIGWAPSLWDGLIKYLVGKKSYQIADLEKAGLALRKDRNQYFDRFHGRLIFTLRNQRGEVVGFSGRVLDPQVKESKYINTAETAVYHKGELLYGLEITKEAIKKENEAIVVEGEIDTLQSFQAGVANVVAIKGTALTEGQINLIKRYAENVSLALDTDLAGDAASRRGIEMADQAGLNIKVIKLTAGKDPDECIRENPSLWLRAVKKATPFYDFLISSAVSRYGDKEAFAKKKIGDEILPFLSKIQNGIIKEHYVKKLAKILDVSADSILTTMGKFAKKETIGEGVVLSSASPQKTREETLGEYLLSLLLKHKSPQEFLKAIVFPKDASLGEEDFVLPSLQKIFKALKDFLEEEFSVKKLVANLPPEILPTLDRLYLWDFPEFDSLEKRLEPEIIKTAYELKRLTWKRQILEISQELKKVEGEKKLKALNQEFNHLSALLKALDSLCESEEKRVKYG